MSIVERMMEIRLVDVTVIDAVLLYALFKALGIVFSFVDALIFRKKYEARRHTIMLDDEDDDDEV